MNELFDLLTTVNAWLALAGLGTIGAGVRWAVMKIVTAINGMSQKFDYLTDGTLASLHSYLYNKGYELLARGWVTPSELDDMEYTWKAYRNLGGNGTGELIYKRVQGLEIRQSKTTNPDLQALERSAEKHLDR